jgi:hypothetical protein
MKVPLVFPPSFCGTLLFVAVRVVVTRQKCSGGDEKTATSAGPSHCRNVARVAVGAGHRACRPPTKFLLTRKSYGIPRASTICWPSAASAKNRLEEGAQVFSGAETRRLTGSQAASSAIEWVRCRGTFRRGLFAFGRGHSYSAWCVGLGVAMCRGTWSAMRMP